MHEVRGDLRQLRNGTPVSLRRLVLVPVVGCLVLLAAFAGTVLTLMWHLQREQMQARHEEAVDALAMLIGREMETSKNQLEHMATSPLVEPHTLESFARRCNEILRIRKDWTSVILIDAQGKQHINTLVPAGRALPTDALKTHHARVLESGQPQVSGVFVGAASGSWTVAVSVPVYGGGERPAYVLSVGIAPEYFDALLEQRIRSTRGIAVLLDAEHRVIARTLLAPIERGTVASPEWRNALIGQMQNEWNSQGLNLEATRLTSKPIPHTGWWVVVETPTAMTAGMLGRYLGVLSIGTLIVLAIAVAIQVRHAFGIARHISHVVERALAVAGGEPAIVPESKILELDKLGEAVRRYAQRMAATQEEKARLLADEQAAHAQAEAANQSKDDLLATLSHELRTPLAAISTSVQLLQRDPPTGERGAFALDVIARQSLHLKNLIDKLLDGARISRGALRLEKRPVDLEPLVVEAVADVKVALTDERHRYTVETQSVHVLGDYTALHQVVVNLISNAIRHTPSGGTIRITVRTETTDAMIEVRDNGAGLAAEHLTRIFDPFYRVAAQTKDGLGIGLAFVKRVVEGHGGKVVAMSEGPGTGAMFRVSLPRTTATEESAAAAS